METHVPVLLDEVLEHLAFVGDGIYADGTFGRGGHSRAILRCLGPRGRLLAMDRDPEAVRAGRELARTDARFVIEQESFSHLQQFLERHGVGGGVNGILLDLGVSTPQLADSARGFSFQTDGPLDMRMDPEQELSAAAWLASASEREIGDVLRRLGEEPAARKIARAICIRRETRPVRSTSDLAGLVEQVVPRKPGGKHPATRIFQAIRIHVNRELEELEAALARVPAQLKPGGRLCVISFHSLEDRIVKRFLRDKSRVSPALSRLPRVPDSARPTLRLPCSAVHASDAEVLKNPRARSAVLRVAERLA